uniref:Transmembrane protein n=1 Tax=Clandestinovirus TaxID=2831644 RepID=A0A8F8KPM2_9VIRU|nr:transmembrane protein [Clandestinovirus]
MSAMNQNPLTEILAIPTERLNDPKFTQYMNEKRGNTSLILEPLALSDASKTDTLMPTNAAATNLFGTQGTTFDIEPYLTPPYFGLASSIFVFGVLTAFPGKSFTRIPDLDEPDNRRRDWLGIALTSSTVGISVWFLSSYLSLV